MMNTLSAVRRSTTLTVCFALILFSFANFPSHAIAQDAEADGAAAQVEDGDLSLDRAGVHEELSGVGVAGLSAPG